MTRNETIFWVLPPITVFQIGLKDLLHRVYDSKCFGQLNYLQWKDWQIANIFSLSSSIWWSHWSEMKESRLQLPASLTSNSKVKTVNVLLRFVIGNQHFIQLKHFVINNLQLNRYLPYFKIYHILYKNLFFKMVAFGSFATASNIDLTRKSRTEKGAFGNYDW